MLPDTNTDGAAHNDGFDPGLLADITRVLLPYLGPYSITTVKRASRAAQSAADLVRIVATHIDDAAKRELFLRSAKAILSEHERPSVAPTSASALSPNLHKTGGRPATPITAELVQRGEAALAPIIGPLAGILASRHASVAENSRDFFERLAGHLRTREERDAFFMSVRTYTGLSQIGV